MTDTQVDNKLLAIGDIGVNNKLQNKGRPERLPVHSQGDSQSDNKVMDNITVRQGETVFLSTNVYKCCCGLNPMHELRIHREHSFPNSSRNSGRCMELH
ncbi:unnamed protein product [Boreogadus saida]